MPQLTDYDVIVVNTSAGKDSQAMLDYLVELADAEALDRARLVAAHADLGRVEWPGTRELAEEQVAHYGLRFEVVRNPNWTDLLERIENRGSFPDNARRWCTSDFKRGPVATLFTRLTSELRTKGQPVRILNCMGMRAQESPARAKRTPFRRDERATNGKRIVDEWLPIHAWTETDVWARIGASGVRHHPAYDAGMPRLSCSFCVLASKGALVRAAQLRPELAAEYAGVEARINHTFRKDLSMAEIIAEAARTHDAGYPVESWNA